MQPRLASSCEICASTLELMKFKGFLLCLGCAQNLVEFMRIDQAASLPKLDEAEYYAAISKPTLWRQRLEIWLKKQIADLLWKGGVRE